MSYELANATDEKLLEELLNDERYEQLKSYEINVQLFYTENGSSACTSQSNVECTSYLNRLHHRFLLLYYHIGPKSTISDTTHLTI
jgi:hypothetical protein